MLPSQPQLTGKRKPDDSNPLLHAAAAKRAKKEAAKTAASTKRKFNQDDGPSSLMIVRGTDSQPSQSQPARTTYNDDQPPRFASQPLAGSSQPPSKKFKVDARSREPTRNNNADPSVDPEVEQDVRAMDDEADRLRRLSRAHTTIDQTFLQSQTNVQFPTRSEPPPSARKGKNKILDTSAPMPDHDTPKIERNKQLRADAMSAYENSRGRTQEPGPSQGHRRKSSVSGRGKRMSTSFEATGIITQPHNSVSESSFYKHIDVDIPEPERIRQLLIWCSLRASSTPTSSSSKASSSKSSLPAISDTATQALKAVQDDVVQKLAEKRIDLSLYSSPPSQRTPPEELRENAQNVRNRMWEVTYTSHIQQAKAEEEAWKKVSYEYDAFSKKLQTSLETRTEELQTDPQALSAKAKGKRRATGDLTDPETSFLPSLDELPTEFHPTLSLVKAVLGLQGGGDDRIAGGGGKRGITRSGVSREELEDDINCLMPSLEYKVDQIHTWANAARSTTNIAERMLNERFDILSAHLAARVNPLTPTSGTGAGGNEASSNPATQLLSTYVTLQQSKPTGPDPLDLMRALSRVDQERPPAQVGDAARRAAKEVQRAGESGFVGAVGGDKRLTNVPSTPRKMPGTPRRGSTPGRGTTPARDR
ncbi:Mis12-Mtw1 protein family-domain-containing protein [Crepidotus variabilis]|uniref:Mis12-Mtw1 protein family-domain-containing protein n=1 Tax=Crepidotus variabilis TaxID=179855 RepID=A0A9P6ESE9_9AGAR|nr:Mis12-Mtw1 protein family-domain-containing protein [Crepidotus variabilis]